MPTLRIFLDVDNLKEVGKLEAHIGESALILLLLSKGYFQSKNCMREVLAAVRKQKPVLLVHCDNVKKGGASLDDLRHECPRQELRTAIFDRDVPFVPWKSLSDQFNYLSLKIIAQRTLQINLESLHSRRPSTDGEVPAALGDERGPKGAEHKEGSASKATREILQLCRRDECMPGEEFELPRSTVVLFCSGHNAGAKSIGDELVQSVRELQLASEESFLKCRLATHFLLVLDRRTFTDDEEADDQDEAVELVNECRLALARKVPFVLVHVMDGDDGCAFDRFFHVVPRDLLTAGIFKDVATPWLGLHEEFKHKAVETIATRLGARRRLGPSGGLLGKFQRNRRLTAKHRADLNSTLHHLKPSALHLSEHFHHQFALKSTSRSGSTIEKFMSDASRTSLAHTASEKSRVQTMSENSEASFDPPQTPSQRPRDSPENSKSRAPWQDTDAVPEVEIARAPALATHASDVRLVHGPSPGAHVVKVVTLDSENV